METFSTEEFSDSPLPIDRISLLAEIANKEEIATSKALDVTSLIWNEVNSLDEAIAGTRSILKYMFYKAMLSEEEYYYVIEGIEDHLRY